MTAGGIARTLHMRLEQRVLVLDGAMGTELQDARLSAADFGGAAYNGCHEHLVRTRPDVIAGIHEAYVRAGADIISTNSFGATRLVLAEYGLQRDAYALNVAAARLARESVDRCGTGVQFVAGAIGPTTKAISVTGGITFGELVDAFEEQARGLIDGGVDLFLVETCQDTRNVKAALLAIDALASRVGRLPVIVSASINQSGTMLGGQSIEAFAASMSHADVIAIGLNCAVGPAAMAAPLAMLHASSPVAVSCHPNAGLPDEQGRYTESAERFAQHVAPFLERGWLNIVGGCCGTTPAHIAALAREAASARPRPLRDRPRRVAYSGIDLVALDGSPRPVIIGERANAVGSRAFKRMVEGKQWDDAAEVAREQVRHGARIVDVCLQRADGDECADIREMYERLGRAVRAPIMVDTTDLPAMELALSYCQGKSIVNSANLEDGGARLAQVCAIVKRHGAALVLGCIDDDAVQPQALSRERKLAVAQRAVAQAIACGVAAEDLLIDPLVFPCATGDPAYVGAAAETIASIALIKAHLPGVPLVLGISNVSFGLPAAARRIVDSVFLARCVAAGLDLAIANPLSLVAVDQVDATERQMAEDLLFNTPVSGIDGVDSDTPMDWRQQTPAQRVRIAQYHVGTIAAHFRTAASAPPVPTERASTVDRIARCVATGTRAGFIDDLDQMRANGHTPFDIINGPLMAGMNQVATLFKDGKMIVAEVLLSAEVMRAGVRHLEQFIDAADMTPRGTVILATVKDDVHDIGKDLVKIIVANNGYSVVDLGTRVAPEALIEACRRHQPIAIGLSGLLVKSAHQMIATAEALSHAGIRVPLLVGGAALTRQFTAARIAAAYAGPVHYASDAMAGLTIINDIADGGADRCQPSAEPPSYDREPRSAATQSARATVLSTGVAPVAIPRPADLRRHIEHPDVARVWEYVNPFMLYNRHLGFRGDLARQLHDGNETAATLVRVVDDVKRDAAAFIAPRALWQFFETEADGDVLHLFAPGGATPLQSFAFERQPHDHHLCLTDYVMPAGHDGRDHVALFVVTAGRDIAAHAREWADRGELLRSHALQALALETAEATAEWLHQRIRNDWGFADTPTTTMKDLFTSQYRGKRYSFGYPACPELDHQRGLFQLLAPADIGVQLTDGMMMDPEASVSAIVFHHPDATYFAVQSPEQRLHAG